MSDALLDSDAGTLPNSTIPLDDFCQTLSSTDNRVELIAVFHYRERMAARYHDTVGNYTQRFNDTATSPTEGNIRPASM